MANNNKEEIIEDEPGRFRLFKGGETYTLVIPLPQPSPGFDVSHVLTSEEIANYHSHGSASLNDRIKDMEDHFKNYHLQSWR